MNKRTRRVLIWLSTLVSVWLAGCSTAPSQIGVPVTSETVALGAELYAQHCAACHGVNLEGQENWKERDANGYYPAPPHDDSGHTWHHGDENLRGRILNGAEGLDPAFQAASVMPAYRDTLSVEQVDAIIAFFKSNWGPVELERQLEATQREAQSQ